MNMGMTAFPSRLISAATWCDEFSPENRHVSSLRTMKPDVRITSLSYLMAVEGYVGIGKMAIELPPNLGARRLCSRKRHWLMLRAPVPSRSLFLPSDGYGGEQGVGAGD